MDKSENIIILLRKKHVIYEEEMLAYLHEYSDDIYVDNIKSYDALLQTYSRNYNIKLKDKNIKFKDDIYEIEFCELTIYLTAFIDSVYYEIDMEYKVKDVDEVYKQSFNTLNIKYLIRWIKHIFKEA